MTYCFHIAVFLGLCGTGIENETSNSELNAILQRIRQPLKPIDEAQGDKCFINSFVSGISRSVHHDSRIIPLPEVRRGDLGCPPWWRPEPEHMRNIQRLEQKGTEILTSVLKTSLSGD